MSPAVIQPPQQQKRRPTREEGLAIANARKAARARRTERIRKAVAVLAVAAFIGPFSVIYVRMATGNDPALATTGTVSSTASRSLSQGTGSATASAKRDRAANGSGSNGFSSSGSTSSGSSSATSSSPAPMTTQQS